MMKMKMKNTKDENYPAGWLFKSYTFSFTLLSHESVNLSASKKENRILRKSNI